MYPRTRLLAAAAIAIVAAAPGTAWAQAEATPAAPAENEVAPEAEPAPAGDPAAPPADGAAEGQTPAENEAAPAPEAAGAAGEAGELADPLAGMDIDLTTSGTSIEEARVFYEQLDVAQQEEIATLCTGAESAPASMDQDQDAGSPGARLCANLVEAGLVEGPAAR